MAEQNSLDLAWNLLVEDTFKDLRLAICPTRADWVRFRGLLVNGVMATDIVDRELKGLRNQRWEKAFAVKPENIIEESSADSVNRKATIVIEHLIQASDVAHMMQVSQIFVCQRELLFSCTYQSTGTSIASGTKSSSSKCTMLTWQAEPKMTHRSHGTRVRLGSLIFTSFRWPRNYSKSIFVLRNFLFIIYSLQLTLFCAATVGFLENPALNT